MRSLFMLLTFVYLVFIVVNVTFSAPAPADSVTNAEGAKLSPDHILKGMSIFVQLLLGAGGAVGWVAGIRVKRAHDSWKSELERESETHRMRLKKSELLFEERVRAARDLKKVIAIIDKSVGPRIMDQDEYHAAIARDFHVYRDVLETYLTEHAIILPPLAASHLESAEGRAYEFCSGFPEHDEHESRIAAAAFVDTEVKSALRILQEDIFNQAGA